jgi:hypothetical protein
MLLSGLCIGMCVWPFVRMDNGRTSDTRVLPFVFAFLR